MLQSRNYAGIFAAVGFSFLILAGCSKPAEIVNLQIDKVSKMSSEEAVAYLNSVTLDSYEGTERFCNFNKRTVEFISRNEEDGPKMEGYRYLTVSNLFAWRESGRTGLWLLYDKAYPIIDFLELPGCKVLGRKATQEQITKAAQALISLGAIYEKP